MNKKTLDIIQIFDFHKQLITLINLTYIYMNKKTLDIIQIFDFHKQLYLFYLKLN